MARQVVGVYQTSQEAIDAVERLRAQGYSQDTIHLVANDEVRRSIPYGYDIDVEDTDDIRATDDRSFWEKIRDAFSFEESHETAARPEDDPLYSYQKDIDEGSIAVLVDSDETVNFDANTSYGRNEDYIAGATGQGTFADTHPDETFLTEDTFGDARTSSVGTTGTGSYDTTRADLDLDADRDLNYDRLTDEEKIPLREEKLKVDKENIQTGEVRINKRIVEETETVEVPVTHEEVTIERVPVEDHTAHRNAGEIIDEDEEIVIPVHEEQINVDKDHVVTEEIRVKREDVTENKKITDTVQREEVDFDTEGDIDVRR